jgi:hypothetical protein
VSESCSILLMKCCRTKFCPELEPPLSALNLSIDVNSALGTLHCVDVDRVAASTFRVKVSRVGVFMYIEVLVQQTQGGMPLPSHQQ